MKYIFFFSLISLGLLACKSQKELIEEPTIETLNDFSFDFVKSSSLIKVVDRAIEEDKLVFIDIYTDWCMPCQIMDEEVFSDDHLGDYFNEHFISYKVDAEKTNGPDIATLYQIIGYPTLLFIDHKGKVLTKKDGMAFHTELKKLAEEAIQIDLDNRASE